MRKKKAKNCLGCKALDAGTCILGFDTKLVRIGLRSVEVPTTVCLKPTTSKMLNKIIAKGWKK